MKNQYFGDINDYFKYGILRCFSQCGYRVGVCWMLTPDDGRPDGRKTDYLSRPQEWRKHDPELFDGLNTRLNGSEDRCVDWAQDTAILPDAIFHKEITPGREPYRTSWFSDTLIALQTSDLIFFDPDNGIEVSSVRRGKKDSSKYVFWDELKMAWDKGSSLLVFQHYPRIKRTEYIPHRVNALKEQLDNSDVIPIHTSNVLFLLANREEHQSHWNIASELIARRWSGRISMI